MRPALLRLLKRPSAVSIIDSLISAPVEIALLESKSTCLRCHTRRIQKVAAEGEFEPSTGNKPPTSRHQAPDKRPFSFRVYNLDISENVEPSHKASTTDRSIDSRLTAFSLQPDKLEFESDIGHTNNLGSRLVDDPNRRHDFLLWEELLRHRQRRYGDDGTLDIFRGLTRRVGGVYLPTQGSSADFLWRSFVKLGLEREHFLEELADYALKVRSEKGVSWGKFYEAVVGGFFERSLVHHAVKWHKKLQVPHLHRANDILHVLEPALSASTSRFPVLVRGKIRPLSPGVQAFQNICRTVNGHDLYRPIISTLLQRGYAEDALWMHAFLIKRHNPPQSYEDMYPLLDYANKYGLWHEFQKLKAYADREFPANTDQTEAAADERKPTTDAGTLLTPNRSEKKPFKDDFAARLFATAAFSFDTVLAGLEMFRVAAIGPHSLREMAIRSNGSRDIQEKLQKLQKARISIGDSVYVRLLRKLSKENRDILLADLLESDQHPDLLENVEVQESLLVSNYMARDWRQYNLTLAILGESLKNGPELPNIHFRKFVSSGELDFASKMIDEMALDQKSLTQKSINFLVQRVLTVRRAGAHPVTSPGVNPIDGVIFVIRVLQRAIPTGQYVAPELWIELLKRLGMKDCFDKLRNCCLWLVRHYSSRTKQVSGSDTIALASENSEPNTTVLSPDGADRMLQTILGTHMQCAIVSWGFKLRISSNSETKAYNPIVGERLIPWTRGLALLRELEKEGLQLNEPWIRRACRRRLAVIFGRPRQSTRSMNDLLRRENPYTLQQVLADIDRAWGAPLFRGPEKNDLYRLVNPPNATVKTRLRIRRRILENKGTKKWSGIPI